MNDVPLAPDSTQLLYQFRSQFPEFDTTKSADIAVALKVASLFVDSNIWTPTDYPQAMMYWAAHFLTLKAMQLAGVATGGVGSADLYVRSIAFGERHIAFGERRSALTAEKMLGPGEQMLLLTMYGEIYLMLRTRNVVPLAVV